MVMSHHACLSDVIFSLKIEEHSLLEPCEVLTEKEWILGELTPWVDSVEENDVSLEHMDRIQDEGAIIEVARLEEPLDFKITSKAIVVGQDIKDYPNVPIN